ncbi:MAG: hypothetical protein ACR5LF_02675 [Symbiopectobacterium sp.]
MLAIQIQQIDLFTIGFTTGAASVAVDEQVAADRVVLSAKDGDWDILIMVTLGLVITRCGATDDDKTDDDNMNKRRPGQTVRAHLGRGILQCLKQRCYHRRVFLRLMREKPLHQINAGAGRSLQH